MKNLYVPKGKTLHYETLSCQNLVVDGVLVVEETLRARDRALTLLGEIFLLSPRDPFAEVKALQAAFDPAGLAFSEEYCDTLGLERPGQ